jgi:nucleotide-binding universal stress UspA family protein
MKALSPSWTVEASAGTAESPPAKRLIVVVGFDGSPPARHALDRAAELLQYRSGALEVVFVAHLPVGAALSGQAYAEVREGLDEEARTLADEVRDRFAGVAYPWNFQRRDGSVPAELKSAAAEAHRRYGDTADIVIIVGGSAHRYHHFAGSVALSVARADAFPVLVVP